MVLNTFCTALGIGCGREDPRDTVAEVDGDDILGVDGVVDVTGSATGVACWHKQCDTRTPQRPHSGSCRGSGTRCA